MLLRLFAALLLVLAWLTPLFGSRSLGQTVVPRPEVSVGHGWFRATFQVEITCAMAEVTLRFTTDGSEPTEQSGEVYSKPLQIAKTTILRVAGFKPNAVPSPVSTQTYLFADDILRQPNDPAGFPVGPTAWGGYPSDYELDPEIVNDPRYSEVLARAFTDLPTLSLVCQTDDLFSPANGIYTHPLSRGPDWERPCSAEFIPQDASPGFQVNAGLQIQGNASREPQKQPKHPFRLVFKDEYGPRRLDFALFPDSPVTEFDTLVLRADFNFSWLHWNPHQRHRAQRTRDAWLKDTMRAMGGLATHNRYVHLFLNGLYWGVYDLSERPDGAFAASSLGGEKEDYDVMNEGEVVDGDRLAYDEMLALGNLETPSGYAQMQRYLDLPQFIDFMLLHFYAGHQDWFVDKNWYAARPKDGARGFFYLPWDGEMILDEVTDNRVSSRDPPSGLHTKLLANSEYRLAFADRAHRHLFDGGALTPAAVEAAWLKRAGQLEQAIVAESARWGDYRRDVHQFQSAPYELYTRDNQWRAEQHRLLTEYFPRRTAVLLAQLRAAGLYPNVAAPGFSQPAGRVRTGSSLALSAPEGVIYYTLDGTDPRVPFTGAAAGGAQVYNSPFTVQSNVRVKARTLHGGKWSALAEADFLAGAGGLPLRITEIMYHPLDGEEFEFIEMQNGGPLPIDVGGFSFTGVKFVFPHRTILTPGEIVLLASSTDPAAFAKRYPTVSVLGHFKGALSNGGEHVSLLNGERRIVTSVTYQDEGAWPKSADGQGFSLELLDPVADSQAPANWQASALPNGSPGHHEPASPPRTVRLNEVLAYPAVTSAAEDADWVELFNPSADPVSLAGWSLIDERGAEFIFPEQTTMEPGSFLVVWCDGKSLAPDLHAPFGLGRQGDTLVLTDAVARRIDAVSWGPQVAGFALGRIADSAGWALTRPSPGMANDVAPLANPADLKVNEWLANSGAGAADWLELFNPDPERPAALQGLAVAAGNAWFQIASLSFVPPAGFVTLLADERTGPDHLGFRLETSGGFISLIDADGAPIDRVRYNGPVVGLSEGRLTDGGPEVGPLPHGMTPGRSNTPPPQAPDRDHDGLPDAWEIASGLNPDLPDARADPDEDGLSNLAEYQAGTNPLDARSTLQISLHHLPPSGINLEFRAAAYRPYSVLYTEDLQRGAWHKLEDVPPAPTDRVETVTDPAFGPRLRFYMVVIPTQP